MKRSRSPQAAIDTTRQASYPFESEASDHAETPLVAYQHIAPLLHSLAKQLGKTAASLTIWDPFFCAGLMVRHLGSLGFTSVLNRNEDAWQFIGPDATRKPPAHDVLVTNPPFSGANISKLLQHCQQTQQPWLLLLPEFVLRKPYYYSFREAMGQRRLVFLGPSVCPYEFEVPSSTVATSGLSRAQVRAGYFQCIWFVWLGKHHDRILHEWTDAEGCMLTAHVETLPKLAPAPRITPAERRWRRKLKRKAAAATDDHV
jgi:hypothetical protein